MPTVPMVPGAIPPAPENVTRVAGGGRTRRRTGDPCRLPVKFPADKVRVRAPSCKVEPLATVTLPAVVRLAVANWRLEGAVPLPTVNAPIARAEVRVAGLAAVPAPV